MKWFRQIENVSLRAKFTAISLILTVAIAMVMAMGIQKYLEQIALQQEAENAAEQVATLLNPHLRLADFDGPLSTARFTAIDALVRERITSSRHIVRVKLWSRNGMILYSNSHKLVGRRFPEEKELREALEGRIAFSISSLEREENIGERGSFKRLIEIYTP